MTKLKSALLLSMAFTLSACSAQTDAPQVAQSGSTAATKAVMQNASGKYTLESPKIKSLFAKLDMESIVGTPEIIDCEVTGGAMTQCLSITLPLHPKGYEIGPWCPRNIADSDETGGLWIHEGEVFPVSGEFISKLDELYSDETWKLYDEETGIINYTDTLESCIGAAKPNVEPEFKNNCIECSMHYLPQDYQRTWIIPIDPVKLDTPGGSGIAENGVAFSGVLLNAPAPVWAIISHHTIAAFDDCGGHANPNEGYHIHLVVETDDCIKKIDSAPNHAREIGIALDGFMIHERTNVDGSLPSDLDQCLGHEYGDIGYHYHVNETGSNDILPCLSGRGSTIMAAQTHGGGMGGAGAMGAMGGAGMAGAGMAGMAPPTGDQ